MKQGILIAALMVALGGAAQAESLTEKTSVNVVRGVSPSTPDFVKQVAISDLFEIQSSQLAKQNATGAVASFADEMINDHNKTSAELKALVQSGAVKEELPSALDDAHQKKLDALKSMSGVDFAKLYYNDQVTAHNDAVSLFVRYAKGGDNDALNKWAADTLPALQRHLDMALNLNRERKAEEGSNAEPSADGAMPNQSMGRSAYDNPAADPRVAPSNDPAFSGEKQSDSPAFSGQPTPTGQPSKSKP